MTKYLTHYTEKATSEALAKAGAFFAFSDAQFEERKRGGIKYIHLFSGLICPEDNAEWLLKELKAAQDAGVKMDLEENGKDAIIERELINLETEYTGDITDAAERLAKYGITAEEVQAGFNKLRNK